MLHDEFDFDEGLAPNLVQLTTKDRAGRDAAAEARLAGQEANAQWCEVVLARLNPLGEYNSKEKLQWLANDVRD